MFNFTDVILEKNRAEEAIKLGQVTGKNIGKIMKSGAARSALSYSDGVEKGNKEIERVTGAKVHYGGLGNYYPVTFPSMKIFGHKTRAHVFVPNRDDAPILKQLARGKGNPGSLRPTVLRHELDEVRASQRKGRTFGGSILSGVGGAVQFFNDKLKQVVGQHASPKVLQREHDHVAYLSKLDPAHKGMEDLRTNVTGEYNPNLINMKNRDVRKAENRATSRVRQLLSRPSVFSQVKSAFHKSHGLVDFAHRLKSNMQRLQNYPKEGYRVDVSNPTQRLN